MRKTHCSDKIEPTMFMKLHVTIRTCKLFLRHFPISRPPFKHEDQGVDRENTRGAGKGKKGATTDWG